MINEQTKIYFISIRHHTIPEIGNRVRTGTLKIWSDDGQVVIGDLNDDSGSIAGPEAEDLALVESELPVALIDAGLVIGLDAHSVQKRALQWLKTQWQEAISIASEEIRKIDSRTIDHEKLQS
jgi:hypothetical protein